VSSLKDPHVTTYSSNIGVQTIAKFDYKRHVYITLLAPSSGIFSLQMDCKKLCTNGRCSQCMQVFEPGLLENRRLDRDEPVEVEKELVGVRNSVL
jgi:hypothetical protein